jgi:hypothetical protein
MTTRADAFDLQAAMTTLRQPPRAGAIPADADYDVAINAESRTYRDGDDLVSILSVHTLVCPLIRAELRGQARVRVLAYYHAGTRLGLQAYEAALRDGDAVQQRLGLHHFVRDTLKLDDTHAHLHDPGVREMYLHEVIRRLSRAIAACRLQSDDEFLVTRII